MTRFSKPLLVVAALWLVAATHLAEAGVRTFGGGAGWALVIADDLHAGRAGLQGHFGGLCVLDQKNRVSGDSYPKNIYFAGGARCTSQGGPVDVFQEGEVTLYQGFRDSYLAEGNQIFGLQDWSISKGDSPRGTRDLRFTNTLRLRLSTPDGKPWAVVPDQCDRVTPSTLDCQLDKSGRVR